MNPYLQIENRKIGLDYDPLVIAEIGINHGGSLEVALQMVDAAFEAGVEVVKHQTHIVEDEMSKSARSVIPGNADISIFDIMKSCALNEEDEITLQKYVQSKGMIFISTPFSRAAAIRLQKMNVPAFKIGSGECNNYPLIRHICQYKKPIILSTGMNSIESIRKAVDIIREYKISYALLHCTNIYPTPPELVRLNAITELKAAFPDAVLGLSDHTLTNYPCIASVSLGASILERHFTDTKNRVGPDIICSMDLNECKELINAVKIVKKARDGNKGALVEEAATIAFAYATVVTTKEIKIGELFSEDNIWVKRPGTGEILAENYDLIIGKKAKNNLNSDEHVRWDDVEK